jgi:hypothetical protein
MFFNFFNDFKINNYVKTNHAIFLAYYKPYLDSHNSFFFSNSKFTKKNKNEIPCIKISPIYNLGHDIKAFERFDAEKKFIIDDSFLLIDPHRFKDPTDDNVFYEPSLKLYDHDILKKDNTIMMKAIKARFIDKNNTSDRTQSLRNLLDNTPINKANNLNRIIKIIPIQQYNDFFKKSGLENDYLDQGIHFLDTRTPNFLNESAVISEWDILNTDREHDVIITGSNSPLIYPFRYIAKQQLDRIKQGLNILDQSNDFNIMMGAIQGLKNNEDVHNSEVMINNCIYDYYKAYTNSIRKSKFGITCSNIFGYTARRYFEFMSNGCVVVGQLPRNSSDLGFKHMVNVFECEVDELNDAILFLQKNDNIRLQLAMNARKLVLDQYTVERTETKLWNDIERIIKMY